MNNTQLQCFLSVANHLNFARAAKDMHITQPAVTHQINTLEAELETKLFKRTTRSVELTQEGLLFIADAQHILRSMKIAKSKLSDNDPENISFFAIGCHTTTELQLFHPILREFLQKHPHIHPDLKTIASHCLETLLENGTLDVTFGFAEDHPKKNMAYLELMRPRLMCALPRFHPYASKKILTAEDLANEKIILQEPHRVSPVLFELQKPLVDSHLYKDLYLCENTETALTLVKAGLGVTMLLDLKPLRDESLCYLPFENSVSISYGIHYSTRQQTYILKDFLEICQRNLAETVTE